MQSPSPNAPAEQSGDSQGLPGLGTRRPTSDQQTAIAEPRKSARLLSIDAFRGFIMLLIMAEALQFCEVAGALPQSQFWGFLCHHQTHAEWVGCTLHDLIQPGFSFLVGVVLPFSLATRQARGQPFPAMVRHAAIRSVILIFLGLAMIAVHPKKLIWHFDETLTQIGLAYGFVFLLAFRPPRDWWIALGLILFGYWLLFAVFPVMEFGFETVGVSPQWLKENGLTGFAAHWQKNSNAAAAFDYWFIRLFPGESNFVSEKGLCTLNFVPLVGTMILGLFAGNVLRSERSAVEKVRWFLVAGVASLAIGWGLGALGICPVVKSIWTPSWVLFSGGWCFIFLAGWYALVEIGGQKRLVFPLLVLGANSIAAYCLFNIFEAFAFHSLTRVVGHGPFRVFGSAYEPVVYGLAVMLLLWLCLFGLYRRKLFLKI